MPFILAPMITSDSPGMWGEGLAYEKKNIYSIESGKMPPVQYDEHILRSHSLTHIETPAHTMKEGKTLEAYYQNPKTFYGKTLVIRLTGNNYVEKGNGIYHWVVTVDEIEERLKHLGVKEFPEKLLITTEVYPQNPQGYHDPNYVLTLSQESADYLVSHGDFHLYGTSWKSSDFNPGRAERPIHNTLFKRALILENLELKNVPEGFYFMSAFPLPIKNASESPVVPVLFSKDELEIL
ncbi:cyclase family protein [Peredibacter sp. HCB2-198]|uniref:cyclase family protein n=1 Tax=Peredibacter sp. HCB2-198 TaxID=3383025 RepID=UPI0038B4E7BA